MIEYERLIDDIKHMLLVQSQATRSDSDGQLQAQRIVALAADYQSKCQEANERVRQCAQLLRRGLRSEALQLAEQDPNLVELITLLDFPDRPQWCDLLGRSNLPLPPELMIDVAADLNAAYALEQPVAVLLKKHRLQALSRAPLNQRIATIREIAKADATNPVWNEDLLTFEKARHQQIRTEAQIAAKSRDVNFLESLERELGEPGWLAPPPAALIASTKQSFVRLRTAKAREGLAELEPKLLAAHAAGNVAVGRQCRTQWQAHAETAGITDSDPLAQNVSAALQWLAAEDARDQQQADYAAAIAELEQALDGDVPVAELEQLYEDVACHEQGIPEDLDGRARERIAVLQRAASRRSKLMLAGMVLGLICLAGAIFAGVSYKSYRDGVAGSVVVMEQLLGEGRLEAAAKYQADLAAGAPRLAAAPELAALATRLATLQAEEGQRQKAFRQAMDAAIAAAKFDDPTLQSLALASTRMQRDVKPLATIRRDQDELAALVQRVSDSRAGVQKKLDEAFNAQVKLLLLRQEELEASKQALPRADVAEQLHKIQALLDAGNEIGYGPVESLRDLQGRAERFDKTLALHEQMARQIGLLTSAVGNRQAYIAALAAYVQQFPGTPRANGFGQLLSEQALWQAIEDWQTWRSRWGHISWATLDSEAAVGLLMEAQQLLAKSNFAALPFSAQLRADLPYLSAIAERGPGGSGLLRPLSSFLNNRAIAGLRLLQVRDADGNIDRYYLQEPVRRLAQLEKVSGRYVVDFEFKTKSFSASVDSIVAPDAGEGTLDAPAPQAVIAQDALTLFSKHSGWEQTFFTILEHVEQNKELDPLLKVFMYSQIIQVAGKGSHCLAKAFAPYRDELDQANLVLTVNWLDPEDAEAAQERTKAMNALKRLPDLKRIKEAAVADLQSLRTSLPGDLRWIGCLLRDEAPDSSWNCHIVPAESRSPAAVELVVVDRRDPSSPAQIAPVGRLENGKVTLRASDAGFRDGRPVYARPVE